MNYLSKKAEDKVLDTGLDEGSAKLTTEKIGLVISNVLKGSIDPFLKEYLDTCIHCGLCSEACHYYLSHDKDPHYAPVVKVKQTMWEIVKNKGRVSPEFVKKAFEIAQTECDLCRRCAMYCPFGIDVSYIMLIVRRLCYMLGVTPQYVQDRVNSYSVAMNQMWIKEDEWIESLQSLGEKAQPEEPILCIPLEKEGADIMYSVSGSRPGFQAQLIHKMAVIMNAAKVKWTIPATQGWDNCYTALYAGDDEIMGRVIKNHFETAMRLKVKKILIGDCGHVFGSYYNISKRWLGWERYPIPVIHSIEFYYNILQGGRIKIARKLEEPVTLYDPCYMVRGSSLHEMARFVVKALCKEEIIEINQNCDYNYCCGSGAGVTKWGSYWKRKWLSGNKIKAEHLASLTAGIVIVPCYNCYNGLKDIINHYGLSINIRFLADIIYEHMT